jgi:hypothetical protein
MLIHELTYQGPNDDAPGGLFVYALFYAFFLLAAWVVAIVSRLRRSLVRRRYTRLSS